MNLFKPDLILLHAPSVYDFRKEPIMFGPISDVIPSARLCKKYHPAIPVIFGGYSATYFHEELITYPQVDIVVRGDSTEDTMLQLLSVLKNGGSLKEIPGITYKENGRIRINQPAAPASHLNHCSNNYLSLFKNSIKYGVKGFTPIVDWWEYPITAVMTCRGCTQNCVICGGSKFALKKFCGREEIAYRSPERIVEDIKKISRYTRAPIFVVGDLRQSGDDYAQAVLKGLRGITVGNRVVIELFEPAPKSYFKMISESIPHFNLEISPESHDEKVRKASGKFYSNEDMEASISAALEYGCEKFDVFFMIGVPRQTYQSVMETIDYGDYLMQKYDRRLNPFISPLAPFIDPGSIAYEESEKVGYRIFYRTLEEHRQALLMPSWKHTLSYETKWMSRDEIAASTYEAALRLNRLKRTFGLITEEIYQDVEGRIKKAMEVIKKIDEIVEKLPPEERQSALRALKQDIDRVNESTLCHTEEIKWPTAKSPFRFFNIVKDMVMGDRR
ncbi:MAG: radical SAM protein [Proteobacteria bacterium]|nr:radical SAM protein [Pseudomonadota bacterium]